MKTQLRLPAIEIEQSPGRKLYTFAVDGKLVHRFAAVSRLQRTGDGALLGYQRPEVLAHIEEIRNYLHSETPMIPNAIVLAFDTRVSFRPSRGPHSPYSKAGEIVIPYDDEAPENERPGFIVDGQQRLAAIREAQLSSFPICASAFITDDIRQQVEQFILVNSTKPLNKNLVYELLPSTDGMLPSMLFRRRLPAYLLTRLNQDATSPLRGAIQTATNPDGRIKDNSILRMLENSLSEGVLYRIQQGTGGDVEAMLGVLHQFWRAVSRVFPDAMKLPPKKSRLVHGAGIVAMGILMDTIADRYRDRKLAEDLFAKDLEPLAPICRWTDGHWEFGPSQVRKWNEIQNTSKDVQLLVNHLLNIYKDRVWGYHAASRQLPLMESRD